MQIYYTSLQAIKQQTMQLDNECCFHCKQSDQLVSHGYIYKKQQCAEPIAIGKRVFCSNRNRYAGCGRTMRLYLDAMVRYLNYAGSHVVAFVLALMTGMTVQCAYCQTTGIADPRNAYRWLDRLCKQLSDFRSLSHQPLLQEADSSAAAHRPARWPLLASTFNWLGRQFGQSLCENFQLQLQRSFL